MVGYWYIDMSRFLMLLLIGWLAIAPTLAFGAGLVPCGGEGEPACQTCHVVELVNGVIEWLVLILGTIAAIIIVYAGFKLVMSGGNRHAMEEAKSLINNMLIGYVIVLAGWLLVDTGMKMLLTDGETALGMWNQVSCTIQPTVSSQTYRPEMFQPINIVTPVLPGGGGSGSTGGQRLACTQLSNGGDTCLPQQDECRNAGGIPIIDSSSANRFVVCSYQSTGGGGGGHDSGGGGSRPPDLSGVAACDPALIGRHFTSPLVGSAQCIIRAESACGANMVSRTDIMRVDGRAFSFGPMQINLTVHELRGCGATTLPCHTAFSGRNYSARVINETLYQQCAAAAQNVDCNILNGFRIYKEAGNSWRPWSTAAGCGL